jgi:hypothetical protein
LDVRLIVAKKYPPQIKMSIFAKASDFALQAPTGQVAPTGKARRVYIHVFICGWGSASGGTVGAHMLNEIDFMSK